MILSKFFDIFPRYILYNEEFKLILNYKINYINIYNYYSHFITMIWVVTYKEEYSYKNLGQEFYRSNLKLYNMYYKVYNLQLKETIKNHYKIINM